MWVLLVSLFLRADTVPPAAPDCLVITVVDQIILGICTSEIPSGGISIPVASSIASRQVGVAPLAIFFDATGVTSDATIYPFHECYFAWDFGDPTSGTWATNGKSKNAATGGVAAHVFETAGDYTVTLTVTDSTGSTAVRTIPITVTAADVQWAGTKTICFSTSNNFEDAPSGSTHVYTSDWNTVKSYLASDRRLLFRRGETWNVSSSMDISVSGPGMIGVFGPGSDKVTLNKIPGYGVISVGAVSDWRICDLNVTGSGAINNDVDCVVFIDDVPNSDILLIRVTDLVGTVTRGVFAPRWGGIPNLDKLFIVDCTFWHSNWHGAFLCGKHLAVMGTDIGWCKSYALRIDWTRYCTIQACNMHWVYDSDFGGAIILKIYANQNVQGSPSTRWVNISDNLLKERDDNLEAGHWGTCHITPVADDGTDIENIEDVVIERNFMWATSICVGLGGIQRATARNNTFKQLNNPWSSFTGIRLFKSRNNLYAPDHNWLYNNTAYSGLSDVQYGDPFICCLSDGTGTNLIAINNYASAPNITYKYVLYGTWTTESNNQISDTPGFVNPATDNFHLVAGSPAIDSGYNVITIYDDKDEVRRSGTFEKGAYQY